MIQMKRQLSHLLPFIPKTASNYLLIIPLIWESFSTCCCRSLLSLSSRRFWYCRRILLVWCSCKRSLLSYSSSFLWDITSRSFSELISSSYSLTWVRNRKKFHLTCLKANRATSRWYGSKVTGHNVFRYSTDFHTCLNESRQEVYISGNPLV